MSIDASLLSSIEPFKSLLESEREAIASQCNVRQCRSKSIVLASHVAPQHLYVVHKGLLQLSDETEDGRVLTTGFMKPGGMIGWLSAVDGLGSPYTITASQDSELLTIPMDVARTLLKRTEISHFCLNLFSAAIRQHAIDRRMLSMPNAFQRVFYLLLSLVHKLQAHGGSISDLPKQQDIAIMVNTSRETVSRAIQLLIRQGVLTKDGHRIVIHDTQKLARFAYDGAPADSNAETLLSQGSK